MFSNQKLSAKCVLLCILCLVQAEAMEADEKREVPLFDEIKMTPILYKNLTFDTSEDLEKFQQALLTMKVANDCKLIIMLDTLVYFIDKTENIVVEFYRDNLRKMPRGLMGIVTKAKLVDAEELENPRRVRFFYNIKLEYWGMPLSSKKFRRFKMTRLLD